MVYCYSFVFFCRYRCSPNLPQARKGLKASALLRIIDEDLKDARKELCSTLHPALFSIADMFAVLRVLPCRVSITPLCATRTGTYPVSEHIKKDNVGTLSRHAPGKQLANIGEMGSAVLYSQVHHRHN